MLRGRMRLAAEALLLGTALFHAGCAETRWTQVGFETPPGALVRIDGGSSGTIPFKRGMAPGVHEVEVEAPPVSTEGEGKALRGLIVVFARAGEGGARFDMDEADLLRAAGDGVLLWTGVGPFGQEEAFLKATGDGVGREDLDVALAVGRDAERKAAVEAARRERMEQKEEEARMAREARALEKGYAQDAGGAREGGPFPKLHLGDSWVLNGVVIVLIVVGAIVLFSLAQGLGGCR